MRYVKDAPSTPSVMSHSNEAALWLAYAETDLSLAQHIRTSYASAAAYHAQQATEKAIKALLTIHQIPFKKHGGLGHDLEYLHTLLPAVDALSVTRTELSMLSGLVASARYPDNAPLPTDDETSDAMRVAEIVVAEVRARLGASRP